MSQPTAIKAKRHGLSFRQRFLAVLIAGQLGTAGCSSQSKAIESLLQADRGNSTGATSISDVVKRMRAIDSSRCPKDFQSAYLTHIHAWERALQLEQRALEFQKSNSETTLFVESFVRGFLGDPLGKMNEVNAVKSDFAREVQTVQKEIQQTFHEVEKVALKYGAKLPQANP